MSNWNQYMVALMEGKWRPTIDVNKQEDGRYKASWTDGIGNSVEYTDEIQSFAVNQVQGLIRDGVAKGELKPR